MINFAQIKQSVTTRQAAEAYGLSVNSHGMCRCPFHNDHRPSMKVDETFYCFGCGAVGDVITFTARLFGISTGSAAQKLEMDFGIASGDVPVIQKSPVQRKYEDWVYHAREVLRDYNLLLVNWKSRPPNSGEPFLPLFAEALQNSATVKELLWELSFGTEEEKQEIYLHYKEKIREYEQRIEKEHGTNHTAQTFPVRVDASGLQEDTTCRQTHRPARNISPLKSCGPLRGIPFR